MEYNTIPNADELSKILIAIIGALSVLLTVVSYAWRIAAKGNKDTIDSLLQSRVEDRKRIEVLELTQQEEYAAQRLENEQLKKAEDEFRKEVRALRDEVSELKGQLKERENQRTHLLSENSKKDIELGATRQKWKDTLDENTKLSERLNTALKVIESKEIELAEALESKDTLLKVSEAKYNQAEREITGLKATIALLKDQLEARSVVKELIAVVSEQPAEGEMKAPEASADPSVEQNEGQLDQGAKG